MAALHFYKWCLPGQLKNINYTLRHALNEWIILWKYLWKSDSCKKVTEILQKEEKNLQKLTMKIKVFVSLEQEAQSGRMTKIINPGFQGMLGP